MKKFTLLAMMALGGLFCSTPAVASNEGVSSEQTAPPEGAQIETYSMTVTNLMFRGGQGMTYSSVCSQICFDEDGVTVWLNTINSSQIQGWIKGELQGDEIVIKNQVIGMDYPDPDYQFWFVNLDYDSTTGRTTVIEDGECRLKIEGDEICYTGGYSGIYVPTWQSTYCCDIDQKLTKVTEAPVAPSSEAEVEEFIVRYQTAWGSEELRLGAVARDGEKAWVKGLSPNLAEAWVAGTIAEGVLTIPAYQYIGAYYTTLAKWAPVMFEGYDDRGMSIITPLEEAVFNWDEATSTWNQASDFNSADVYYDSPDVMMGSIQKVRMTYYGGDKPAKPATPVFVSYDEEWTPTLIFNLPAEDVDGNFINPAHLTWSLFIDDDEPYVFPNDKYTSFPENVSELDYYYADWFALNTNSDGTHILQILEDLWDTICIQQYYTVDGVRTASDKLRIDYTALSVEKVGDETPVSIEYFDANGRRISNPKSGFMIRKSVMTDGSVKVEKVIKH